MLLNHNQRFAWVFFAGLSLVAFSAAEVGALAQELSVVYRDSKLSVKARNASLEDVLERITHEAKIDLILTAPSPTPITADFQSMDLDKGIKRLIRGLNSVFYYGSRQPGAEDIQLTSVLVISNPDSRTISAIKPADDANPVQDTGGGGAVPYHKLFEDIDRLEEAADTDASAINELARLAESDENKLRRVAALEALGESDAPQFADLLFNIALKDDDFSVRAAAVEALGNVSSGQEATDYLLQTLNDQHPQVRAAALEALGSIGGENVTAALTKALKDEGPLVRATAAEALADIGDKSATPALIEALDDSDEEVREIAQDALEELGENPEKPTGEALEEGSVK